MERREYRAGGGVGSGEDIEVYHLQSGGHSLLAVIIFKRLHPQSVSLMAGMFGHSQFYSLIWALQMCIYESVWVDASVLRYNREILCFKHGFKAYSFWWRARWEDFYQPNVCMLSLVNK